MRTISTTPLILMFLVGCADTAADTAADKAEFRSSDWADVTCTNGSLDRCFAQAGDAKELWSPVVSDCDLEARLDSGEYLYENTNWWYACDSGGYPTTFTDYRCFTYAAGYAECFGGSDGWYTKVVPPCSSTAFSQSAWPTGSCDPDLDPGDHAFDSVEVIPNGPTDLGEAVDGGDAFVVYPACAVPSGVQAGNPYWCY